MKAHLISTVAQPQGRWPPLADRRAKELSRAEMGAQPIYPPEELCTRPERDQRRWEFLVGREQAEFLRLLASGQEEEGQEAQKLSHPKFPGKELRRGPCPCGQSTKWHLCLFKDSWKKVCR